MKTCTMSVGLHPIPPIMLPLTSTLNPTSVIFVLLKVGKPRRVKHQPYHGFARFKDIGCLPSPKPGDLSEHNLR